jgi:hypothetical protein
LLLDHWSQQLPQTVTREVEVEMRIIHGEVDRVAVVNERESAERQTVCLRAGERCVLSEERGYRTVVEQWRFLTRLRIDS